MHPVELSKMAGGEALSEMKELHEEIANRAIREKKFGLAKMEAERKAASQARLTTAARDLSRATDLESIMAVVRRAARELTGADGATFVLRDGGFCYYADEDAIAPLWKGMRFPAETCISGWAMINKQAAVIEDIYADPRIPADAYRPTFVKSLAMVPVRVDDPIAAIGNYWATRQKPSDEAVELLQALADLTSVAMENFYLIEELKSRAEELARQKEAAERANQAKSDFLAKMSHEFRTPMNGIMGMTDLALKCSGNAEVCNYLELAKKSAGHLMNLVNDLLDFSEIEDGGTSVEQSPFSLGEALADSVRQWAPDAASKGLRLDYAVSEHVPDRLIGDGRHLRRILTNLIHNAVKFTEQGSIRVSVEPLATGNEGAIRIQFSVRDTGIGIPSDKQAAIFESFEQVRTNANIKYDGTGLGLSLVRHLIRTMGGDIRVESAPNLGSAFHFTLDFGVADSRLEPAPEIRGQRSAGRPLNILVAEDNKINQIYIQKMLSDKGHRVVIAQNGQEALDRLAGDKFDLVFMDIRMPELCGDEATRIIRTNPPAGVDPAIPVVAVSAYALPNEIDRYMEFGFNAFLTKPLHVDDLDRVLSDF